MKAMQYRVFLTSRAERDLSKLPKPVAERIVRKLAGLREDLRGDVKRLTNMTPEYRLRVGDYRILFEVEAGRVTVHRISHRRDVYRR
jgi:mRNA interferase RelE/StbE